MDRMTVTTLGEGDEDDEEKPVEELEEELEEEEEMGEEEESRGEPSSILLTRIKEVIIEDPKNPYRELDKQRQEIQERIRLNMKTAAKTVVQKADEKKTGIERRLEESDKQLTELLSFGDELVSNIKIANEMREYSRREFEFSRKDSLAEDLKRETIEAIARYDVITARWSELGEMKEPMSLFDEMEKQREKISELMQSKDDIIAKCQAELDRISEKYYADQEKQANDVCCLVERVDNQLELIKVAYKEHMDILHDTIENERQRIALEERTKWEDFHEAMEEEETRKIKIIHDKADYYSKQMERINSDQDEITRATRIRLEKDAEMLQWELRRVRNNVLMNSEKLDYNFQVLQKRNDENVIINNQQKRRVAKLTEAISLMRKKIAQATIDSENTLRRLNLDIQKLHATITQLERKSQYFKLNNKKKFDQIWEINFRQLKTSMKKVFEIDRILHEQQLAMPWTYPDVDFTDINQPEPNGIRDGKVDGSGDYQKKATVSTKDAKRKQEENRPPETRLLRNILRRVADRAGFLVEDKLLKLLEPFSDEAKHLVRVDNIFSALHIREIKEISSLMPYFEQYAYCPNCSGGLVPEAVECFFSHPKRKFSEKKSVSENRPSDMHAASYAKARASTVHGASAVGSVLALSSPATAAESVPNCDNHYFIIEPAMVLTALNDFTTARAYERSDLPPGYDEVKEFAINLIKPTDDEIREFWKKFSAYMPDKKEKLWNVLEHGLNHYMDVLKQRQQLDEDCRFLRKQNRELKHLLQKFKV